MRVLESRMLCIVLWLASLAGLMLSCGCQTSVKSLFIASGPGWHVQEGQALWRPQHGYPEIGGDVVLASHEDGRCLIQFAKTPMSLVLAQTTGPNWPGSREVGGVAPPPSHEDGRCLIQFAKTPMSLVLAQTTGTNWLIQFPPARMSFSGRGKSPTRFAWQIG